MLPSSVYYGFNFMTIFGSELVGHSSDLIVLLGAVYILQSFNYSGNTPVLTTLSYVFSLSWGK